MTVLWDTKWQYIEGEGTKGDWALAAEGEDGNSGGLSYQDKIGTAIIIALFTNAKLPDYMLDEENYTKQDQHEWHGNTFGIEPDEAPLGSMLFTLKRAPLNETTARMAEHYCAAALQIMIRRRWVNSFDIEAQVDKEAGLLAIHIVAHLPNEPPKRYRADLFPLQ